MANGPVPFKPSPPALADVSGANAVLGSTQERIGSLLNHVQGRGVQVAPFCMIEDGITLSASTTYTFPIVFRPSYAPKVRQWRPWVTGSGTYRFKANSVTALTFSPSASIYSPTFKPATFYETIGTRTVGNVSGTFTISNASAAMKYYGISCCEVPRMRLAVGAGLPTAVDCGVESSALAGGEPIVSSTAIATDNGDWATLGKLSSYWTTIGQRSGHYFWAVPYLAGGTPTDSFAKSSTATSFGGAGSTSDLFKLGIPLLGRVGNLDDSTGQTETTTLLVFVLFYRVTGGATGQVRVTMTNGDVVTITGLTSTTYTNTPVTGNTINVDAEDNRRYPLSGWYSGLRQAGGGATRWDEATIEAIVDTGTIYVTMVSIYESQLT